MWRFVVFLVLVVGCSESRSQSPPIFGRGDVVTVKPIAQPGQPVSTKPVDPTEQVPPVIVGIIRDYGSHDGRWKYTVMFSREDLSYWENELLLHRKAEWIVQPSIPEVSEPHFP